MVADLPVPKDSDIDLAFRCFLRFCVCIGSSYFAILKDIHVIEGRVHFSNLPEYMEITRLTSVMFQYHFKIQPNFSGVMVVIQVIPKSCFCVLSQYVRNNGLVR
jgi:hypothetical protein